MTFLAVSHRYAQPNKLAFDESYSIDGANKEDVTSLKKQRSLRDDDWPHSQGSISLPRESADTIRDIDDEAPRKTEGTAAFPVARNRRKFLSEETLEREGEEETPEE